MLARLAAQARMGFPDGLGLDAGLDRNVVVGDRLPGLGGIAARAERIHLHALHGELEAQRRAGILALEFVELPLPRQQPQRVGERRRKSRLQRDRRRLRLQPRNAGNGRLLLVADDSLRRRRFVHCDAHEISFGSDLAERELGGRMSRERLEALARFAQHLEHAHAGQIVGVSVRQIVAGQHGA